jgi:acetoin utilization protein AcuB
MLVEQLISPLIPILEPADSGSKALYLMDELHLSQLPLVKENEYMALVQENDVMDWNTPEYPLSGASFLHYRPAVMGHVHPYEALRISHQQNLEIIPVVDKANKYLGAITRDDLLKFFAENSGLDTPGGIIVLELEPRSYSLAEIARICESEDVTVTSSQLRTDPATGMMEVLLKTNRTDLSAVVHSFERHEYQVKEVFGAQIAEEEMQDRYRLLMNYLNM